MDCHLLLVPIGVLFGDYTAKTHADSALNQQDLATQAKPLFSAAEENGTARKKRQERDAHNPGRHGGDG